MSLITDAARKIEESFSYQDSIDQSAWQTYAATTRHFGFDSGVTITGSYYVIGRTCHAQIKIDPGANFTSYQASSFVTLPITAVGYTGVATANVYGSVVSSTPAVVVVSTSVVRIGQLGAHAVPMYVYAIYQI